MGDDEGRKPAGGQGQPGAGSTRDPAGGQGQPGNGSSSRIPAWAVAGATFVAGLLLGAGVFALASSDDDATPQAAPSASPSPSPTPTPEPAPVAGDVLIRVPGSCVRVADQAEAAVQEADELAAAVRDFNARQLQEIVDRYQRLRPEIEALAEQCRDEAGSGLADGDLVSSAPAATPS